ncbi:hypothetical protein [Pinibacter aurantiacus]|uniref:DUF4848 domain-containing protein n=1 Tax=Pinibacter aurantiacus TaxID=2851599 RepID=A0A9E2S638_9BACT|nr:hypothetical protein [Pinibacter aurantiacus]MBV4356322.1 hypothetical protein [Pinibacter aurantiacus]
MKNKLLVIISLLTLISCSKKDSLVSNKENDLSKTKEFVRALGFDLNKVTIETKSNVNPDSVLKFNSAKEGRNYFKKYLEALDRPRRANCLDTLRMLSKSPKEYDAYFKSLIERHKNSANGKNNKRSELAAASFDPSYIGILDQETDEWSVWNQCELETLYNDYDPTLPSNYPRWWSDYQNGAFSMYKGVAVLNKNNDYFLQFDYSLRYPDPLVCNVRTWRSPTPGCIWTSWDGGDFHNDPGSSFIHFNTQGTENYSADQGDGTTVIIHRPVFFDGLYNCRTKEYVLYITSFSF